MRVRKVLLLTGIVSIAFTVGAEATISTAEIHRLQDAAAVVRDLRDVSDKGIPEDLWSRAECVVVIPSLKKAGLGIGGEYGRGVMSCRQGDKWGAPLFMQMAKGTWGLQIGVEEIDLVMMVMNRRGADKLINNKVSLGGDASVAAGPIGRSGTASTDAQLSAEILWYSRARGVFAGIDVSGGILRPDEDANTDAYGPNHSPREIISGTGIKAPAAASDFMRALSEETRATSGRR